MSGAAAIAVALLGLAQHPSARAQGECHDPPKDVSAELPRGRWTPEVHERLVKVIRRFGVAGGKWDRCKRPLAVLDVDHTVITGDLGEAVFAAAAEELWFVADEPFFALMPEKHRDEIRRLWPKVEEGKEPPKATPRLRWLLHASLEETCTAQGQEACDAWRTRVFQKRSLRELEVFASRVIQESLVRGYETETLAAEGTGSALVVRRGVRIRIEMEELIGALVASGFDVFLASAAPDWALRAFAWRVGLPADQVIGVRPVVDPRWVAEDRVLTPIPSRAGKVLAVRTRVAPGGRVPVLVAGDSEADWELLAESSGEALLIDRGVPKLKAHAQAAGWMIQPLFKPNPWR